MRFPRFLLWFLTAALIAAILFVIFVRPRTSPFLRASTIVTESETGIPGISKWYETKITNLGPWPIVIKRCDAIDDAGGRERFVAYGIQRWNQRTMKWESVAILDSTNFCKPYPLGIVSADLHDGWLWPGQSLSTGEEITGARLRKGDTARFVVFTEFAGDFAHSVAAEPFSNGEEVSQPDIPFRVRH